jgi:hypothetical protein
MAMINAQWPVNRIRPAYSTLPKLIIKHGFVLIHADTVFVSIPLIELVSLAFTLFPVSVVRIIARTTLPTADELV